MHTFLLQFITFIFFYSNRVIKFLNNLYYYHLSPFVYYLLNWYKTFFTDIFIVFSLLNRIHLIPFSYAVALSWNSLIYFHHTNAISKDYIIHYIIYIVDRLSFISSTIRCIDRFLYFELFHCIFLVVYNF